MRVEIAERDGAEATRLRLDPDAMVDHLIGYMPVPDLAGISKIIFADEPFNKASRERGALATYYPKYGGRPAFIEVYIKNLFGHVKTAESFKMTLPIRLRGLAEAIFHEVGHHVAKKRTHGIRKNKEESFAEAYALRLLTSYVLENAAEIDRCLERLEKLGAENGISMEILQKMKDTWIQEYRATVARAEKWSMIPRNEDA